MLYEVYSDKSPEATEEVGLGGNVSNVRCDVLDTSIRLSWDKSPDPDVAYYGVEYHTDSNPLNSGSGLTYVGDVVGVIGEHNNPAGLDTSPIIVPVVGNVDISFDPSSPSIVIEGLEVGYTYFFQVRAYNSSGGFTSVTEELPGNVALSISASPVALAIPGNVQLVVQAKTRAITVTWATQ